MKRNKKGSAKIWVIVCLLILLIPSILAGILATVYHDELIDYAKNNNIESVIEHYIQG